MIDPALAPLADSIQRAIEDDGSDLRDTHRHSSASRASSCAPAGSA